MKWNGKAFGVVVQRTDEHGKTTRCSLVWDDGVGQLWPPNQQIQQVAKATVLSVLERLRVLGYWNAIDVLEGDPVLGGEVMAVSARCEGQAEPRGLVMILPMAKTRPEQADLARFLVGLSEGRVKNC